MPVGDLETSYFNIIDSIGTMASLDNADTFLADVASMYGLRDVAYLAFDPLVKQEGHSFYSGTYKPNWQHHYVEQNFFETDPVITDGFKTVLPFSWSGEAFENPKVRNFFKAADDFGVGDRGISFPIRGTHGEKAVFTVTNLGCPTEWDKRARHFMRDFQLLSYHIHQTVSRCQIGQEPIKLARRERECLRWAAAGKTVSEIAIILSISDRTVRMFLDIARNKLNTMNVTHSVAKALSLNLL